MACFLVPAAEALVTTLAEKGIEKKENDAEKEQNGAEQSEFASTAKKPFVQKLKWLRNLLWGGSALLMFEHVWHGEVVPFFPFLTAASNPEDTAEMIHEMSTVGVAMAALVTLVWAGMVLVTSRIEKRADVEKVSAK